MPLPHACLPAPAPFLFWGSPPAPPNTPHAQAQHSTHGNLAWLFFFLGVGNLGLGWGPGEPRSQEHHSMRPRYRVPQAQLPLAHPGEARGKDVSFPREDGPHGPQPFVGGKPLLGGRRGGHRVSTGQGEGMRGESGSVPETSAGSCSWWARGGHGGRSWGAHEVPGGPRSAWRGSARRGPQHGAGRAPPSRTRSQRPSCRSLILLKPVVKILPSAMKMARMGRAPSCGLSFSCAGR